METVKIQFQNVSKAFFANRAQSTKQAGIYLTNPLNLLFGKKTFSQKKKGNNQKISLF